MPERTGNLKERTVVLIVKRDWFSANEYVYAEAGSPVVWDGETSNAGHEEPYGDRHLLWANVLHEGAWYSKGLEEGEVEWDE